jgi:hypothetical protein
MPMAVRSSENCNGEWNNHLLQMIKLRIAVFSMTINLLNRHFLKLDHHVGLIREWVGVIQRRSLTRGTVETIGFVKELRLCYTRFLCGAPFSGMTPGLGIQLDETGLPKEGLLNPLFRERDPTSLRLGFTLLGISRILPGWKSPDLSSVTAPSQANDLSVLTGDLVGVVKELGWKLPRTEWSECHVTTKTGPNAQALVGSIEDAALLTDDQLKLLAILGGEAVIRSIETVRTLSPLTWLAHFKLSPKGRSGKLGLVRDKEAKTRIVALLDYWTQSVLKPLHEAEMAFLKRLRPDMTFNQGGFRSHLPGVGPYHSLDLTAATDRFPVETQEAILAQMVGSSEWAAAWRSLICDRDYTISWGNRRDTVRYSVGQPMGAYSSWATFAIAHHAVVRLAAKRAGFPVSFTRYALLGDDIVIANDAVANEYRAIIRQLGIEVSETKTHVSQDTYEFAKRWICKGSEVSGATFGALFEAISFLSERRIKALGKDFVPTRAIKAVSYWEIVSWFKGIEERWKPRSLSGSRGLFADIFQVLGRGALSERLSEKAWKVYLLPSREDSRLVRNMKFEKLGLMLIPGILGCFS